MTPFDPRLPIIAAEARVKTCHVHHCWHALRDMGKQFHAGAFAAFAGLSETHVAAILTALEAHDALPERRTVTTRGQRLPLDWTAPPDWLEWASQERRWPPLDCLQEAAKFADYWHAKPGKDAAKLDWRKTWQNWCRNSSRPNGTYSAPAQHDFASHAEQIERTAALYERMGRTVEAAELRAQLHANVVPIRASGLI